VICRIDIVAPTTALKPSGSGSLPVGSAEDIETAKAEFKAAWEALKARTSPEQLARAFRSMNIRDED
jgi:hypothetical protein